MSWVGGVLQAFVQIGLPLAGKALGALWRFAMTPVGRIVLLALLVAVLVAAAYLYGRHDGRAAGRVDQLQDTVKAYEKRKGIDNDANNLDRVALCIELGGLRDECEQLRGLDETAPGK